MLCHKNVHFYFFAQLCTNYVKSWDDFTSTTVDQFEELQSAGDYINSL